MKLPKSVSDRIETTTLALDNIRSSLRAIAKGVPGPDAYDCLAEYGAELRRLADGLDEVAFYQQAKQITASAAWRGQPKGKPLTIKEKKRLDKGSELG